MERLSLLKEQQVAQCTDVFPMVSSLELITKSATQSQKEKHMSIIKEAVSGSTLDAYIAKHNGQKVEKKTAVAEKNKEKQFIDTSVQKHYATTNAEFARSADFISACTKHNIKPTTRMASKFRNKKGSLYNITGGKL
jgi:hypothetical protein